MDFARDKYDLFNAPQYVDFNEFLENDGLGNDNADEFFVNHREEDDFFPNDKLSPTAQLLQDQNEFNSSQIIQEEVKTSGQTIQDYSKYATTDSHNASVVITSAPQSSALAGQNDQKYYQEIDYEEELRKMELLKQEKAKKIAKLQEIERNKIKLRLEEGERAINEYTVAKQTQKIEPNTEKEIVVGETVLHVSLVSSPEEMGVDNSIIAMQEFVSNGKPAETIEIISPEIKVEIEDLKYADVREPTVARAAAVCNSEKSVQFVQDVKYIPDVEVEKSEHPAKGARIAVVPRMKEQIQPPKKLRLKVTVPQPFKFSELRPRKIQEAEKEIEQYKFKAKPVPVKVLQGAVAYFKPPPKVTQPQEMHFASEDRIQVRHLKQRKSVPASRETAEAPRKTKPGLSSSKSTIESANSTEKISGSDRISRARSNTPSKCANIRTRSLSADRSTPTKVKPFSFEERDKELLRKKEEKIRNAIRAGTKIKEFHAQPVPRFPKPLPPKQLIPATAIKPFKLKADERGLSYQQEFQRKIEEEAQKLKKQAEFTAQSADVIYRKPFEPEKPSIPLAEPLDIVLNTDRRADERSKFDNLIKERDTKLEEQRKQDQLLLEEEEKKLCATLRQMCVHKARPMPKNKIFELKVNGRPLTEPRSPAFELLPSQRRSRFTENKENVN